MFLSGGLGEAMDRTAVTGDGPDREAQARKQQRKYIKDDGLEKYLSDRVSGNMRGGKSQDTQTSGVGDYREPSTHTSSGEEITEKDAFAGLDKLNWRLRQHLQGDVKGNGTWQPDAQEKGPDWASPSDDHHP